MLKYTEMGPGCYIKHMLMPVWDQYKRYLFKVKVKSLNTNVTKCPGNFRAILNISNTSLSVITSTRIKTTQPPSMLLTWIKG